MPVAGFRPEYSAQDAQSDHFNMTATIGGIQSAKPSQEAGGDFDNFKDMGVKERLENLRKLFAEEDINETVKNI